MSGPPRVTRRRFLKRSFLAGSAVAAAPYLVPSAALASADRPGANDRIGVGYVGVGRRARQLMSLPPEGQIVAAADVYLKRAEEIAQKYNGKPFQDYRKMLESKDVDAVVLATPDHWRALTCIHACQAGKDIYAEKPMTLTIHEGRLMVQAVRKYKRVFQTGSQQRSDHVNRLGCELVRNGRIGKVHTVIGSNYPSPWEGKLPGQPVPEGLDWDMWCGPTEPVPYHTDLYTPRANPGWISFRPYSGGEVTGWGAHGLDQVQWALGMDETGPVEIWTEGDAFNPPVYTKPESRTRGDKVCKSPGVFYRYASGTVLRLGDEGPGGGAVFLGEKGTITIDRSKLKSDPVEIAQEPIRDSDVRLYKSDNHMQNWFDCMKSREKPVADVEIGHRSTTVCHLANIARWLGRRAVWDPAKEIFPGDDEANAYLDRPRRKPYELPDSV
jgi:predicted dehydrogenase